MFRARYSRGFTLALAGLLVATLPVGAVGRGGASSPAVVDAPPPAHTAPTPTCRAAPLHAPGSLSYRGGEAAPSPDTTRADTTRATLSSDFPFAPPLASPTEPRTRLAPVRIDRGSRERWVGLVDLGDNLPFWIRRPDPEPRRDYEAWSPD